MKTSQNVSDISVLIVSFNCWKLLNACLKSLYASETAFKEIIVIDNASIDETKEQVNKQYPEILFFENSENIGHTRAVNQGCRIAKGEFILLLDADTEVNKNCVSILESFLLKHPHVSMVGPKTYLGDGTLQDSAKSFPTPLNGIFGRQSFLTRRFPNNPLSRRYLVLTDHDLCTSTPVDYVSAACMLFRNKIFGKIGEWDEKYHSYWVDADWCKRIALSGGNIYYIPEAVIIHHEQNHRSLKKNPNRIIWFHTGAYRFYCKHNKMGALDPRRFIAALLLGFRGLILLMVNSLKKTSVSRIDPLTLGGGKK